MNDTSRDKERHTVAVYGTLKGLDRGGRFAFKKGEVVYLGRAYTLLDNFIMHGGSFPVVNRNPKSDNKGRVLVEVYDVSTSVLSRLDAYEGAPSFYDSEPVSLQMETDGRDEVALMYLGRSVNSTLSSRPIIKPSSGVLYWPFPAEHKPEAL